MQFGPLAHSRKRAAHSIYPDLRAGTAPDAQALPAPRSTAKLKTIEPSLVNDLAANARLVRRYNKSAHLGEDLLTHVVKRPLDRKDAASHA